MIRMKLSNIAHRPIPCLLSVYRALGIEQVAKEYAEKNHIDHFCFVDCLFCNAKTYEQLKKMIAASWSHYDFSFDGNDYRVIKEYKRAKRSPEITENDLSMEFLNLGPTIIPTPEERDGVWCDGAWAWFRQPCYRHHYGIPDGEIWFDDQGEILRDNPGLKNSGGHDEN